MWLFLTNVTKQTTEFSLTLHILTIGGKKYEVGDTIEVLSEHLPS